MLGELQCNVRICTAAAVYKNSIIAYVVAAAQSPVIIKVTPIFFRSPLLSSVITALPDALQSHHLIISADADALPITAAAASAAMMLPKYAMQRTLLTAI